MGQNVAIVTGTSSGIGRHLARLLLERGWAVTGVARRVVAFDGPYEHAALDLSDLAATRSWFEERWQPRWPAASLDRLVLVNNAGTVAPTAPLHRLEPDRLERALVLNAIVPAWLMGLAVRHAPAVPVRIVNLSTGAALNPYPGWGAYCLGKAALRMAGLVLASEVDEVPELQGRDVAVVSYAPGVVDTPMQHEVRASPHDDFPRLARFEALQRDGKLVDPTLPAEEIARLLERDDLPRFSELRFGG